MSLSIALTSVTVLARQSGVRQPGIQLDGKQQSWFGKATRQFTPFLSMYKVGKMQPHSASVANTQEVMHCSSADAFESLQMDMVVLDDHVTKESRARNHILGT